MRRQPLLILIFSIAFLVFFISPSLLNRQFGAYPLIKIGDVLDIFTPLILIPLYWLLFRLGINKAPSLKENLIFMLFVVFWVIGQGMHLAANSIGHLLKGMEGSDVYNLTYFYDEVLSHHLWHFGIVGLSAFLIFRQWQNPFIEEQAKLWPLILAGVIHGFTFFLIIVEAGTAPLGVTFAVLVVLFGLIWGRKKMSQQPLVTFFVMSYTVATFFFIGWGIYWLGLPQFSELALL